MRTNLSLKVVLRILFTLALVSTSAAQVTPTSITKEKLLGRWRGSGTNDLTCMLVFDGERVKIHTFSSKQHLSTVNPRYHIEPKKGKVTLGSYGEAIALPSGDLQVKITRQVEGVVIVRDATVQRMPEPKSKESPK